MPSHGLMDIVMIIIDVGTKQNNPVHMMMIIYHLPFNSPYYQITIIELMKPTKKFIVYDKHKRTRTDTNTK